MEKIYRLFICLWVMSYTAQAQTPILLANKTTTYAVAGKLVSRIQTPDKHVHVLYMAYVGKDKTFQFTMVEYDEEGILRNLEVITLPTAQLNVQKDGYGSRVEVEENEYFGGKVAQLTLLCANQNDTCFAKESIDVWAEEPAKKTTATFAIYHFSKQADAEAILQEVLSKK